MKKLATVLAAVLIAPLIFALGTKEGETSTLVVGAASEPHAQMLWQIAPDLAEQGINLKVVESNDNDYLNMSLENGSMDANFFQHIPFMELYNKEKGTHLVSVGRVHIEPLALYSSKITSLIELRKGATVAIPDDPTNTGRALLLLQKAGLIQLAPGAGSRGTIQNIIINTRDLEFIQVSSNKIASMLKNVDAAMINGNYALEAGLSAAKDGLLVEDNDIPYANVVAVREGNQNDPRIIALVKALQSKKIKQFIEERYPAGEVICVF